MKTLVERRVQVGRSQAALQAHLAGVTAWPSWARHPRSAELEPEGPLRPDSVGVFRLAGGIPTGFRMVRFDPPRSWMWAGRFPWLRVDYDHVIDAAGPQASEVTFRVDVGGLGTAVFGRLFARVYRRNLDTAIPHLVAEPEGDSQPSAPSPRE
ncbi:MAG: SRPBCC family protein [Planctomycetota bacterium]